MDEVPSLLNEAIVDEMKMIKWENNTHERKYPWETDNLQINT